VLPRHQYPLQSLQNERARNEMHFLISGKMEKSKAQTKATNLNSVSPNDRGGDS